MKETPVEKKSNMPHGGHKKKKPDPMRAAEIARARAQNPDAIKKGISSESQNGPIGANAVPAVHGSQPAYKQGSELMYMQLQASLQQTGDLNHPETQKKEMDYKMTLSLSDLRDYHDIKSGNTAKNAGAEPAAKVASGDPVAPVVAKTPAAVKETPAEDQKAIAQQPADTKQDTPAVAKTPAAVKEITAEDQKIVPQQPVKTKQDAPVAAKEPAAKEITAEDQKIVPQQPADTKQDAPVAAKEPAVKEITEEEQKAIPQQPTAAKQDKPVTEKDPVTPKATEKAQNTGGSQQQNVKPDAPVTARQEKENPGPIQANSKNPESKEGIKSGKENGEKEKEIVVPEVIGAVIAPRMDNAVDSEKGDIAPDPDTMLNIAGLVAMAQEFRDQGQAAKAEAESQKGSIKMLSGKIKGLEKEVQKSDADLQTVGKNVAQEENVVILAEKGLATSVGRQLKVQQEVGIYQQEYNKNKGKANDMNREAAALLGGSKKHEDPGEADSGKLTQKLNELSSGANTIAQAMTQAGNTTQKLSQEAQQAKVQNEKAQKDNAQAKKSLVIARAKLSAGEQKNEKAKADLKVLTPQLKTNEAEAKKLGQEAHGLLLDSYIIENDVNKTQEAYYKDMATVEGINALKRKENEKMTEAPSELNRGESLLVAFSGLESEESRVDFLSKLDESDLDLLKTKYDEVTTNYDANEAEKQTLIEQNATTIREEQIGGFNDKRKSALKRPMDLVTKNLGRITGLKRIWMAVSLALSGIWDSVKSISVVEVLKTMLYPSRWVQTIGDSIKGIWTDLSSWKGFSQDPVGMILQKAAGIANKLLAITGVITSVLGLLTIAAAVGSFFTLGALVPLTAWLGGATITMGTITFWIGAVALGLNVLNGIKNIYDIHTAKTAEVMFKNTGELKDDIANSGAAIMAMIDGKGAIKKGQLMKTYPKTSGMRSFIGMRNSIKGALVSIPRRIVSIFKKETWLASFERFKAAYAKVKSWVKEKLPSKEPIKKDPMRYGPYEEQVGPDRMKEQPLAPDKKITNIVEKPGVDITSESFKDFYKSVKGLNDLELGKKSYDLFKNQKWGDLEKLFKENNINGGWPPYDGFISKSPGVLKGGKILLDRYGGKMVDGKFTDTGTYFAKAGTEFESRALPGSFLEKKVPLNTYEILKDLPVLEGEAIPWFDQPGKGIQYQTPFGVDELIEKGYIKRIN